MKRRHHPARRARPKQWRYLVSEWLVERAITVLSGTPAAAQNATFQHLLERLEEARGWLVAEWKRDYPQDWPEINGDNV